MRPIWQALTTGPESSKARYSTSGQVSVKEMILNTVISCASPARRHMLGPLEVWEHI